MKNEEKYIKEVLIGFQNNKGKASVYCLPPFNVDKLIPYIVSMYRNRHTEQSILFVVDTFAKRIKINNVLTETNLSNKVNIVTENYCNKNYSYNYGLCILINPNDFETINKLHYSSKFTLVIFTEQKNNDLILNVRNILPNIETTINPNDLVTDKINSPVEEWRIAVELSDEDRETYDKYTRYVNDSMRVFGDLETIKKCRIGDVENNISAAEFRYNLAINNNWSETLDTDIEFNKQIDEIYNPNSLYERANLVYNIIRERTNLIVNNKAKFTEIENIIRDNPNKHILLVSMKGDFANDIAKYINDNNIARCGLYHNEIETQYLQDENGETIRYKTGANKGKFKPFGAVALSKIYLDAFNNPDNPYHLNCLSIKNSSDTAINTKVDIIIFTSSLCFSVTDFILRYPKIELTEPKKVYRIYCNNTIEYSKMQTIQNSKNVKVIESQTEVKIDEKSGDIIL